MTEPAFDTYPTSFVGRGRELDELTALLARERLVTIIGPPGTGKTRLAMRVADRCRESGDFDQVWFVDATGATTGPELSARVAIAIGATTEPDAIARRLGDAGSPLIALDNFEHLVEEAPATVGAWLPSSASVRFLVTSRQKLRIAGERAFELLPLAVPEESDSSVRAVAQSEAGRLFLDRAQDYVLTDDDAPTVAAILRHLDGIPLALELAATRMSVLGPRAILDRLSQRFELLSAGPRGAAARQATLEGAIEWSWTMLEPAEKSTMLQCSVFRGGFSIEGAQEVVELPGGGRVLDLLQSLTDRSLLRRIDRETGRFAFYESIREFAAARLQATAECDGVLRRYATYYGRVGAELGRSPSGTRGPGFLKRFEIELDNLAAAFQLAVEAPDLARAGIARALQAVIDAERVMSGRPKLGSFHALRDAGYDAARAAGMLDGQPADPTRIRITAYRFLAAVHAALGRPEDGRSHCDRALALADELGEPLEGARTLYSFGALQSEPGRVEDGMRMLEQALLLARGARDRTLEWRILAQLGNLRLAAGMTDTAEVAYEQALAVVDEGDRPLVLGNLATAYLDRGKLIEAREQFDVVAAAFATAGRRRHQGSALGYAGVAAHMLADIGDAIARYERAIELLTAEGARRVGALFASALASAHAMAGRASHARAALASADSLCRDIDDSGLWAVLALHRANVALSTARSDGDEPAIAAARDAAAVLIDAALGGGDPHILWRGGPWPLTDQWDDIRFAARLLRRALSDDTLAVAVDGAWFRVPGGERVSLARRHVLRRLLCALADHRLDHPGDTISLEDLIAAGWPEERMDATAAANRVHVALTTLRKLGLRDMLQRSEPGYRLDPRVPLARE